MYNFSNLQTRPHFYFPREMSDTEKEALRQTTEVITDTQEILSKIRERTATMSEQNKKAAAKYVADIRDILKERTRRSVQKLNEMILDKIPEIENELNSFDALVIGIQSGLVDIFNKDIKTEYDSIVQNMDSENVTESLDRLIRIVKREMSDMLDDIDLMYKNYSNELVDTVINKVTNTTDRISMLLTAEREHANNTLQNRIDICYNISLQNVQIADQLKSTMKVIKDIADTRKKVDTLAFSVEDLDEYSKQTFDDAKSHLTKTEQTDREFLDALAEDESNFLGSLVTKDSFEDNENTKTFVLGSFKAVIGNLPKYVNETMSKYVVLKDEDLKKMATEVEASLKKIGDDLRAKAALINSTATRNEYLEKANFENLKSWMAKRFANVSQQVNAIFQDRKDGWIDALECTAEYINENQLPYLNDLSVRNYLPTNICPFVDQFPEVCANHRKSTGQ